jgi:hypothetical protein
MVVLMISMSGTEYCGIGQKLTARIWAVSPSKLNLGGTQMVDGGMGKGETPLNKGRFLSAFSIN